MNKHQRWYSAKELCLSCVDCSLYRTRTNVVFGEGNLNATFVLVGRDPGPEEDIIGRPFIGAAGKRLDKALLKADVDRKSLYVTNLNHCNSTNNIGPTKEQRESCLKWLLTELRIIQPKKIILFGKEVSNYILNKNLSMSQLHGKEFKDQDTGIIISCVYHPSYIIRNMENEGLQKSFDSVIKKLLSSAQ